MSDNERVLLRLISEGFFSIGEDGSIWRHQVFTRVGNRRPVLARRAERQTHGGYLRVSVGTNGKSVAAYAHRLVWMSLNHDIPEGLEVNHRNGKRSDNRPSNLEIVTKSGNLLHSYRELGRTRMAGERNGRAKLTRAQVQEIRRRRTRGEAGRALAREYAVSPLLVRRVMKEDLWNDEYPEVR